MKAAIWTQIETFSAKNSIFSHWFLSFLHFTFVGAPKQRNGDHICALKLKKSFLILKISLVQKNVTIGNLRL